MTLLLHALSTPERVGEVPRGLRGQPVVRVDVDGLVAWSTRIAESKFGRTDLLEHHRIITCLHAQLAACLPARFPTWLADEAALWTDVSRRQTALRTSLEAVRGRCEVAVTVLWTAPPEPGPPTRAATPGTRYLRARQRAFEGSDQRRDRARELADEIERVAGDDLVAVQRQVCPSALVALSSALLAPRGHAAELMHRLARTQPGVRILVNGPWPPYTFAAIPEPQA